MSVPSEKSKTIKARGNIFIKMGAKTLRIEFLVGLWQNINYSSLRSAKIKSWPIGTANL